MTIPPKRMHWWYEAVMDWLETNPDKRLKDCAKHFKKTPTWIYTLVNSDIFKARLAERRTLITERIHVQLEDLAATSLGLLEEKMRKKSQNLGIKPILETAQMALEALGFAARKNASAAPQVQVNIGLVDKTVIAEARETYRALQAPIPNGAPVVDLTNEREPELALPSPT